ncbi:ankyrin repeat-containing protein ITN1-like [Gastrolobium bilobum]|uniref:ankyrin repeat-containing protein ITN1-like n=1 Tax=Gastrolobium bilobum TaxID=150636 RepID=UPI002AB113EB|nr:ankyrin repeat-containing protein ITN1-like [Gastrolobium bilobum]
MENLGYPNLEDDRMRELYEASLNGRVSTLNTLIQRDPRILSRVSLYPCTETRLHIASLLGHLEFCKVLLDKNPSLASEENSEGRCPLHLASAKGHTETVKALLLTNPETCLIRDKDDKLPLHYAAMRGRIGTIKELISVRPDSIREITENDDGSILHLCVRHNHLEALKLLVESVNGDNQFLSAKDKEDNTILHLAVKHRQIKIIKYLLSLSEMSTAMNNLNREGLTSLDMLGSSPRDSISLKIEHMLTEAGVQRFAQQPLPNSAPSNEPQQPLTSPNIVKENHDPNRWKRLEKFCTRYLINQGNWIDKKTREQLMVAATVIATMAFQSAINPPGGVWQADTKDGNNACTTYKLCEAGTAVVGYVWSPDFQKFIFFNSASFFASLCVLLILISGFPLDNKAIMWILAVLMIVAVTCMLLTYMWALALVSPNHIYYRIRGLGYVMVGAWSFLLGVVGLIQTTRIVFWVRSRRHRSSKNAPPSQNSPGRLIML